MTEPSHDLADTAPAWPERLPPCEALEVRHFPHGEILLVRRPGRRLQILVSPARLDVNDVRPGELLAALVLLAAGMAIAVAMWFVLAADLLLTLGGMALLAAITIVTLYFAERSVRPRARLEGGDLVVPRLGRTRRFPLATVEAFAVDGDHVVVQAGGERVELAELPDPEQRAVAAAVLRAAADQMRETGRIDPATLDACAPRG